LKIIGVIPARYKSSRFPGKPLADICGKPMIWWVYQNVKKVPEFNEIYVATDDRRIEIECKKLKLNVVMTSEKHSTGSDRVAEVAKKIDADIYVNIQGDEPLAKASTIKKILIPFKNKADKITVTNLMTEIKDMADLNDSTVPKVVVNLKNDAVFLSRFPIPYPKRREKLRYFKQVSVYGFTPESLDQFSKLKRGPAELAEDIEVLRFIENDINVRMVEVDQDTIAVDTPSDLKAVIKIIESKKH